jgi:predicted O-methyltransferase YrrM
MNIEKALTIDGWMVECELYCLADLASKAINIAEIGSWMGRSTVALATNTVGTVHAIDTWAGSNETAHLLELEDRSPDWLLQTFKNNIAEFSNIIIHQMTSLEAANYFLSMNKKFDLIFIDASHNYDDVKADIIAWKSLLSEGGIICGHDFTSGWPGVQQAVTELIPNFKVYSTIWISN